VRKLTVQIAKRVLNCVPAYPAEGYLPLDLLTEEIAAARAKGELEDERSGGLLKFFPNVGRLCPERVLDLGCGFGGRTIEFQRRFSCPTLGLEIDERIASLAQRFARSVDATGVNFIAAVGESIPLASDSVDLILSYDVLEHVEFPERVLAECFRILRPGGLACLVFPPYYHPTGSHLEGYVSRAPYANVLFRPGTLLRAVDEILEERGNGYRPQPMRPGDKLYCLNGLTIRRFKRIVRRLGFQYTRLELLPLFSRMNSRYAQLKMKYYAWAFGFLPKVPILREGFTHRVVATLQKP
jgi:SAM-dependent methyltransferase